MKTITTLSLAAALAFGLAACGGTEAGEGPAAPPETVAAPPVEPQPTEAEPTPEPEPTEEPSENFDDAINDFGEEWEYTDGVIVNVQHVGATTATEYAAGAEVGASVLLFEVTITNNSGVILDATEAYSTVNYGDTTAERVFDDGLTSTLQGKILPGKSMTEVQGFAIPADTPQEVLYIITPTWEHEEALFYGTISPAAV